MRHHRDNPALNLKTTGRPTPLAGLALTVLLPAQGSSIANIALPTLAGQFSAPIPHVQWVVLAYLLSITALIVGVGRLGDLMGKRRLLLTGIAIFAAASALAAFSPNLWLLIGARALQGLGAAIMMALSIAFAAAVAPKDRAGSTMGLMGTMSAVGTALGPSLGGLLIAGPGWPAIFAINLPLCLVAWVLVRRHLPADTETTAPESFDLAGTVLLAGTLSAYALATTPLHGVFGGLNGAMLALAGLGLLVFVRHQSAQQTPLLRLDLLTHAGRRASLAGSALVATVMMATLVVGPFHLSRGLGLPATLVGLAVTAGPLAAALAALPAGRLVDRLGTGLTTRIGLLGVGSGCAILAAIPASSGVAGYVLPLILVTASYALFQTANNTAVMAGIPPEHRGVTSGLLNLSRNLGLLTGASVMGAMFALAVGDIATAHPDQVATATQITFALAAGLTALGFWVLRTGFSPDG